MLSLVADADFNGTVFRGVLRKQPDLDLVRVQDVGLRTAEDPVILAWAAAENRIVLTHDRQTMTAFATARIAAGEQMPGLFVIRDEGPIGAMIDAVLLVALGSDQPEWANVIQFLPL